MSTFEATATVLILVMLLLLGGDATTGENFKQLDVKEEIAAVRITDHSRSMANPHKVTEFNEKQNETSWRLHLLHRDHLPTTHLNSSYWHRLHHRLRRDRKRVAALYRSVRHSSSRQLGNYHVDEDFGTDVVSGMEEGSGEYFVRVGVGSPRPRYQYMVIDSGSDMIWVQCQPCAQCYRQSDPVFNPAESHSFAGVTCGSTVCSQLKNSGCHAGHCRYEVSYGDGSSTKGTLALEILTVGGIMVHNVAMGCGHRNQGLFVGAAGLLGLGGGSLSFVGQVAGPTGGAFGYCLVTRGSSGSYGSLVFGRGAIPVGATWVPLIRNLHAPSLYYVGLKGLGVGGQTVPNIPGEAFELTDSGDGGVVMDTGTAVTRLTEPAYYALRDAFVMATVDLPRSPGVSIFDTCYDLSGFVSVRVPTVSFYFSSGPVLTLPARNFMIPVDEMGTFCFAFAPSRSRLSIVGNIQQEGIQISFDGANGFVGFGPNTC